MSLAQQYPYSFNGTKVTNEVLRYHENELKKIYTDLNNLLGLSGHGHTGSGTDGAKITAADIVNVAAGAIAATDIQAAINELDTEKLAVGGTAATATLAAEATKLETARTISFTGAATGSGSFDGTADVPIALTSTEPSSLAIFSDTKASGTHGGTATSGSWLTRTLNTSDYNGLTTGAVLASNQVTLAAGTYEVSGTSPCRNVDQFQARLQNITDGTTAILGTSEYSNGSTAGNISSHLDGIFTIADSKVFELQYRCTTTNATYGLGVAAAFGNNEVFSRIKIRKIG